MEHKGNGGEAGGSGGAGVNMPNPRVIKAFGAFILFLVLLGIVSKASGWLVDWLWMVELGYSPLFLRLIWIKLLLFAVAFAFVFLYLWINLKLAAGRQKGGFIQYQAEDMADVYEFRRGARPAGIIAIAIAVIPALIFGLGFSSAWDTFLRYLWGGPFGRVDPLFGHDIAFYMFSLPAYGAIQGSLSGLTFLAIPITFAGYFLYRQIRLSPESLKNARMFIHLSVLFVIFLIVWGAGHYLSIFGLLYEKRGAVFGAGYTDYHMVRIGLWIMMGATALLAALVLWNLKRRAIKVILAGAGGYIVLMVIVLGILPAVIQSYVVQPNELSLEKPFLEHNIALTRQAYQLDRVEERPFAALDDLSAAAVARNSDTLKNVRLWDWRPVLQTFRQTQEMRLYYRFYQVDVDRYHLPGEGYRQVMVSARELSEQVFQQARTWVNQHLEFTHGYGLAMSYVSEITQEGFPRMIVKDVPPESTLLKIDRPAIYYGENMSGYAIVRTGVEEFDYPKGDKNVYTSYAGTGGIPLAGFWKKLLFSWELMDSNILISGYIKPDSRIQLYRTVRERIGRIVPFLSLDPDPYLVLASGKLFWIQDCYTTSSRYPYSDPYSSRLNYIRNPVKAVVDAYNGAVTFYVSDPDDPVLAAYARAFPGTFMPASKMPEDLAAHIRYPEDIFRIQSDRLVTYHMTDPRVFYNREDVWALPTQKYAGKTSAMDPYYALIRLPGEQDLQFLVMLPMTPFKRENMVAWMAAVCDRPDYGRLIVYRLPKERLIYGPMQVEAMIDQEPTISQQFSLWDQRGSRVIRGNLLVIPIENSFLYVEPVYLIAEEVNIPQLIRVIAAYGTHVAMQPTLEGAIRSVFSGIPAVAPAEAAAGAKAGAKALAAPPAARPSQDYLGMARKELRQAEDALKKGDWSEFGRAMGELSKTLGK